MQSNRTIQGAIDLGMVIAAYCHRPSCGHRGKVDLLKLRDRFGPDHGALYDDLKPYLVCSKCGGKEIGLICSPGENEQRGPGGAHNHSNAYQKAKEGR